MGKDIAPQWACSPEISAIYEINDYGTMIADSVRIDAYLRALEQVVMPGSTVLDIGTGCGLMAIKACQLGARKVYAIEPETVVNLARKIANDNQCGDRIELIQGLSTNIELPERVDTIVADLRGVLPFYRGNVSSLIDARERFLKPGGVLIPHRDTLWAEVLEDEKTYAGLTAPWESTACAGANIQYN